MNHRKTKSVKQTYRNQSLSAKLNKKVVKNYRYIEEIITGTI